METRNKFSKFILAILSMFLWGGVMAQSGSHQESPVSWELDFDREKSQLNIKANMDHGWHVYALTLPSDEGPIPTEIIFSKLNGGELIGEVVSPNPIEEYDPNFDMQIRYYEETVTFSQKIRVTNPQNFSVKGLVSYMACNDSGCLPPVNWDFNVNEMSTDKKEGSNE